MKRFVMLFSILLCFLPNLAAEEFVPKHASIQQNGQTIEVKDLSGLPSFNADYNPQDDVVKIRCSAGNLTLTKGLFYYGCSFVKQGLHITARAYVENGKLEQIVYEEWDRTKNITVVANYYKKWRAYLPIIILTNKKPTFI